MFRPTLAALALVLPATALAEEAPLPSAGPPGHCTTCLAPAATVTSRPADLQRRIGVSARVVSLTLAEPGSDATRSEYGGGGVAASYRISRRWEVALALDALDAPQGPDLHSGSISARFHLTPHRRWDWYLIAGLGVLHEVPLEGEEHADDGGRGRVHAGVGLARRWTKWSLAAELHSVAVGPKESVDPMSTTHATTPPPAMQTRDELSGGELTIAATFFF